MSQRYSDTLFLSEVLKAVYETSMGNFLPAERIKDSMPDLEDDLVSVMATTILCLAIAATSKHERKVWDTLADAFTEQSNG